MIVRFEQLPAKDLKPLLHEAREEGFRFLDRLQNEWALDANRFDREGEAFFGYFPTLRIRPIEST
jgi:hypothetical protein